MIEFEEWIKYPRYSDGLMDWHVITAPVGECVDGGHKHEIIRMPHDFEVNSEVYRMEEMVLRKCRCADCGKIFIVAGNFTISVNGESADGCLRYSVPGPEVEIMRVGKFTAWANVRDHRVIVRNENDVVAIGEGYA